MANRICSVEGCDRPFDTRSDEVDYCAAHYNRLRRHGDPLAGGTFRVGSSQNNPCAFDGCEQRAKARGLCQGHYNQWKKGQELRSLRTFNFARDGQKRCPKCEQTLPLDVFSKKAGRYAWLCKDCTAIYNRAQTYGLSFDEVKEMLGRTCAGCGEASIGKMAHVDHDHATGEVRGLLCNRCNHILTEHATPELLRRLADYLES